VCHPHSVRIQNFAAEANLGGRAEEILSWIHEAGNPYFDWLFGGANEARHVIMSRMLSETSEISLRNTTLLVNGSGDVLGGFIALTGKDLAERRMADIVAHLRQVGMSGRADLMRRVQMSRDLFAAVEPDEFYLSKLGVRRTARGRGYGRVLVHEFLRVGAARGLRRFVLDVSEGNAAALQLYASTGFRVSTRSQVAEGGLAYLNMRRDLAEAEIAAYLDATTDTVRPVPSSEPRAPSIESCDTPVPRSGG
jgi:ribosomal protein S18 acetylase RimI-like enzyme